MFRQLLIIRPDRATKESGVYSVGTDNGVRSIKQYY